MPDSYGNYHANLRESAIQYRSWGWSIIPIRGDFDPENPKAAAVSWKQFQKRQPTVTEIESWFGEKKFGGLGIVCGPVSGVVVLDFDDSDCADAFARVCPDLTQTYTVTSGKRQLPHYYFRIESDIVVDTRRTAGADLQAAGSYVIAPATTIAGHAWNVSYGIEPLTLTTADIKRIHAFLDTYHYSETTKQIISEQMLAGTTAVDLIRQYCYLARQIGRNNALFRMGSVARDLGWSLSDATAGLLDSHIVQPANGSHAEETPEQRRQEGLHTLASAFRYAPKPRLQSRSARRGLPNAIREALLQQGQVAVARLLDGLIMAGMERKTQFTDKTACELVRAYGIGRRTVQSALRILRPLTSTPKSPRNPPKEVNANAADGKNKRKNNCSFVTSANRVKTSGRPAQIYLLPTNGQLYRWLGTRPSGSDMLDAAALQSPTAYRQALQKALIERRPGHYSRGWLAGRLGISVWTSRRYDRAIGVTVQPSYHEDRIYWSNIEHLPLQTHMTRPQGIFIQAADGRCYPPLRTIATRLLRQKQQLVLKRRHWNYYGIYNNWAGLPAASMSDERQQFFSEEIHKYSAIHIRSEESFPKAPTLSSANERFESEPTELLAATPAESEKFLWVCPGCMKTRLDTERPGACEKCQRSDWECVPAAIWQDVERCKAWWGSRYQQYRENQLAPARQPDRLNARQLRIADRLYQRIRQSTPDHAITRRAARRLVREHGVDAIEQALKLLGKRSSIHNAAGFIITVLRGSKRNKTRQLPGTTADHTAWVEKLRQSPYAQYVVNADQFLNELPEQNLGVKN